MPFSTQSRRRHHHHRSNIDRLAPPTATATATATANAATYLPNPHSNHHDFPNRNQPCAHSTYNVGAHAAGAPPPLKRRRSDDDPQAVMYDVRRSHPIQPHHNREGCAVSGAVASCTDGGCSSYGRWPAIPPEGGGDKALVTRDEIERCSPSRKDGINLVLETQLRYSYCSYLQHLGMRLQLPQTTVGTAIILCHRFFFRRSHACHDRFLIATAALFLSAKSEETPCLLNSLIRASCEVSQELDLPFFPYLVHSVNIKPFTRVMPFSIIAYISFYEWSRKYVLMLLRMHFGSIGNADSVFHLKLISKWYNNVNAQLILATLK